MRFCAFRPRPVKKPSTVAERVRYTVRIDDRPGWFDSEHPHRGYERGFLEQAALRAPEGNRGPSAVARGVIPSVVDKSDLCCSRKVSPVREINYELHIPTFTPGKPLGTYEQASRKMPRVSRVATTVEMMPPTLTTGPINWGYDTTSTGALNEAPGGWKQYAGLVRKCHRLGLRFLCDVQYNHRGPEGDSRTEFVDLFPGTHEWGHGIAWREHADAYTTILQQTLEEMDFHAPPRRYRRLAVRPYDGNGSPL